MYYREEMLVKVCRNLAIWAHEFNKQTYSYGYDGVALPYVVHLHDVVNVLHQHDVTDPVILSAAWLHDTLEDTPLDDPEELKKILIEKMRLVNDGRSDGYDVAQVTSIVEAVKAVTNPVHLKTRAEKHAALYPQLVGNPHGMAVKLADRIANMSSGGKSGMYLKEHQTFIGYLYRPNYYHATKHDDFGGGTYESRVSDHLQATIAKLWKSYFGWYDHLRREAAKPKKSDG